MVLAIGISLSVFGVICIILAQISQNKTDKIVEEKLEEANKKLQIVDGLVTAREKELQSLESRVQHKRETLAEDLAAVELNYKMLAAEYYNKYIDDIKIISDNFEHEKHDCEAEYAECEKKLNDIKKVLVAAVRETAKNQLQNKEDFAKIVIDNKAKYEIGVIKSIETMLSDARPLNMLIWTSYYSKPMNDLCSRVIGKDKLTGIYKITNTLDNKVYIGQAVDIKQRWRTHAKCGLGIDTPANNKLYQAMLKDGLENFIFEVVEVCDAKELNDKEKTYIDLYSSYNFGYNSTRGGGAIK